MTELSVGRGAKGILDVVIVAVVAVRAEEQYLSCIVLVSCLKQSRRSRAT